MLSFQRKAVHTNESVKVSPFSPPHNCTSVPLLPSVIPLYALHITTRAAAAATAAAAAAAANIGFR